MAVVEDGDEEPGEGCDEEPDEGVLCPILSSGMLIPDGRAVVVLVGGAVLVPRGEGGPEVMVDSSRNFGPFPSEEPRDRCGETMITSGFPEAASGWGMGGRSASHIS